MNPPLHPIRRTAYLTVAVLAIAVAASVSAQTVITPDLKATPGSYNTSSPGMVLRAHQIPITRSPGDQNSIANVLKELSGGFGPSLSGATNGPLTGCFWREDYLNYALDSAVLSDAQWWFFAAAMLPFPGINTDTSMTGGVSTFAFDIVTFLNLLAGTNYLVVGSGDSFRLTIGVGDNPYDLTAVQPGNGQADGTRNYDTSSSRSTCKVPGFTRFASSLDKVAARPGCSSTRCTTKVPRKPLTTCAFWSTIQIRPYPGLN
jgi:hypothetical protein